jgi:hypothetical protein
MKGKSERVCERRCRASGVDKRTTETCKLCHVVMLQCMLHHMHQIKSRNPLASAHSPVEWR